MQENVENEKKSLYDIEVADEGSLFPDEEPDYATERTSFGT